MKRQRSQKNHLEHFPTAGPRSCPWDDLRRELLFLQGGVGKQGEAPVMEPGWVEQVPGERWA